MACKEGQFDVVDLFKTFSINLNAQHVNGMTPFHLAIALLLLFFLVPLENLFYDLLKEEMP